MNRLLLLFLLSCLISSKALSQLSLHGTPESYSLKLKEEQILPLKILNPIDTSFLLAEEKEKGIPNRYGVVQQIEIDIKKEGITTEIQGKGTIWQYEIKSPIAFSLGIFFKTFHLPEGATVFIYNEEHSRLAGAFSSINNFASNQLPIADFPGMNAIIEYFEPFNAAFPGTLVIGSVTQSYKSLLMPTQGRIQINCPQGVNWQDVKHSVCMMTFYDTQYSYQCSGFLINNEREDGKPYFQTANHCLSTSSLAATLVTYFNYENTTCSSNDARLNQTLAGATISATNAYSDFTLLLLNEYPNADFFPYYSGWDASNSAPKTGTSIHHPSGTPKCISTDINPPTSYANTITWQENNVAAGTTQPNTHWEVLFTSGTIESGSSGSPLFNEKQLAIGQLHGGTANDDFYGKFSLSWNVSNLPNQQLQHWLDPDNTDLLTLPGTYMTVKPITRFSTILTKVCKGAPIQFTDQSKFIPNQWNWNITPSGYYFANGTNSHSKNPEIVFTNDGNYSISLTTANNYGTDSLLKTNYISSGNIEVTLTGLPADGVVFGCNLNNYLMSASGADSYSFNIERPDKISQSSSFDQLYLSLIPAEKKNGSFNSWIKVTGTQGTCIVSDSLLLKVSMPPVVLTGLPPDGVVCGCNLNNYKIIATGADKYAFSIERPDKITPIQTSNVLSISLIAAEKKNGSFNSWIRVTGTQGSCVLSDSLLLKISMPPNDDIENATQLNPGTNATFTNFCSSVQHNEPYPPSTDCYTADSWCPVAGNADSVLTHTIWFKFIGSPSGKISVDTHGFSDRIAIYEADNYSNLISGNSTLYRILAANEGRSASDLTSILENVPVQPYKIYWIQLEGHNKATGECSIDLLTNSIEVYPNPSTGEFNISILGKSDGIADVKIMSIIGNVIYSNKIPVSLDSNKFLFDLSGQAAGIYFIQATIDGTKTTAKLMLVK